MTADRNWPIIDGVAKWWKPIDAAAVDKISDKQSMLFVKSGGRREVRIRSHRTAQRLSGAIAVIIAGATAVWFWRATVLADQCDGELACVQPAEALRSLQLIIATIGLFSGAAIAIYMGRFAIEGRIWRRSRELAILHASLIIAWLAVWSIGALSV